LEIPARFEQLELETQNNDALDEQQTRDHAVEIAGNLETFSEDFLLLRRGLKLLLSMPRKAIVSKFSSDVCFSILKQLQTQTPTLHSDIVMYCSIRRLCFEIL
jgi:hypothetical protein